MITEWLHGVFSAAAAWSGEAILLRLLLATMVGTVIGLDREYRNKGAGIKTHVLVCLGSAMTMIVSQYVAVTYPEFNADVNRIGSQVVSGVKELLKKLHSWDCECSDFAITKDIAGSRGCAVTVTVKLEHMGRKQAFIDSIDMLDFVSFCDEL